MTMSFGRLAPHVLALLAMFAISFLYARAAPDFAPTPAAVEAPVF
jgi:hypothetical protein